jgi:hypothetical protein
MQTDNQFGELLKDPVSGSDTENVSQCLTPPLSSKWMAPLNREPVNMSVRALVIGGGFRSVLV